MKKLLSVLLSVLMIMSCLSVGFGVFAEGEEPSEAEALINKINEAIVNATTEEYDDSGNITRHTAGYWFSRQTQAASFDISGDDKNYLITILDSYYPEYSAFTYEDAIDDEGHTKNFPDFPAIGTYELVQKLKGVSGIDTSNADAMYTSLDEKTVLDKQVRKNSVAEESLGDEVLREFNIDAEKVASVEENSLIFNDIDIYAGDKVTDSVIPEIAKIYPDFSGTAKGYVDKATKAGFKFDSFEFKYTNIRLDAQFDGDDRITGLTLTYDIVINADMRYSTETLTLSGSQSNKVEYYGFDYFDEGNEFDYAELVRKINEATANAVNSKAGYDFTKTAAADNNQAIKLDLTQEAYEMLSGLSDSAQTAVFGVVDQVTVAIDNLAGTSITKYEWVCDQENCPVCSIEGECHEGDHSKETVKKWVCEGHGCPVCEQHQDDAGNIIECENQDWMEPYVRQNMPWMDDQQVAEEVASMKSRCTCGEQDAPLCTCDKQIAPHKLSVEVMGNVYDVNMLLDKGITAITGKLNDVQTDSLKGVMELGAYHATVPASKNPDEYIESKYALKATELSVNDLDVDTGWDYNDGTITFWIPYQENPDENSALAHLTNNFATGDQFAGATAEALTGKIDGDVIQSMSTGIVYSGSYEGNGMADQYTPIQVDVKFAGASDDNIYGNGELESLVINYTCYYEYALAAANFIEIAHANYSSTMDSSYTDFNYVDYEKGDTDLSQRVSIIDAKLVLKYIVGTEDLNELQQEIADMDNSGDLSVVDAKMILQLIADQA